MDANTSIAATHLGSTLAVVGGMNWLKNAKWFPLLSDGRKYLNRVISVIVAFGVVTGISFVWNGADHSLLVTGLTLAGVSKGLFHWGAQYLYQETGYQALGVIQTVQAILAKVEAIAAAPAAPLPAAPVAPAIAPAVGK